MGSLIHNKLQNYLTKSVKISIKFDGNRSVEGVIKELDATFCCIQASDGNEEVITIETIRGIRVLEDIASTLRAAFSSHQPLMVTFPDNTTRKVFVEEYDNTTVSFTGSEGEEIVQIKDITQAKLLPANENPAPVSPPTFPQTVPSPKPDGLSTQPVLPVQTLVSFNDKYPNVSKAAEWMRRQLTLLSWPDFDLQPIERNCPVSIRINSVAGRLWGKALNYHNDSSWLKAADTFVEFANSYPNFYTGYFNAGVCYNLHSDTNHAISNYEKALAIRETAEVYRNGIWSCVRAGFWQLAIQWMNKYLVYSSGSDSNAPLVMNFQLKYGLFKDAIQSVANACSLAYPVDITTGLNVAAYLAARNPSMAAQMVSEVESGFSNPNFTIENLRQLAQIMERGISNQATIDYVSAQDAESLWRDTIQNEKKQAEIYALHQKLKVQLTKKLTTDAINTCNEILGLNPADRTAQDTLNQLVQANTKKTTGGKATPAPASRPYQSVYSQADKARQSGRLDEAERLFLTCIANSDNLEKSVTLLANIYLRRDRVPEGINLVSKYLSRANNKEPFYNTLGTLYFKAGNYSASIDAYTHVRDMQIDQNKRINPMMSMAAIHFRMGELERTEEILNSVLQINPNHQEAKNFIGRLKTQSETQSDDQTASNPPIIDDIDTLIASMTRPVGLSSVGVSRFMRMEVEDGTITGLDRLRIERKSYTIRDAEYLFRQGQDIKTTRPEQRLPFFLSSAKILSELNEESDEKFNDSLRNYSATSGDYYAIKNRDSARTYYMEAFKLEPKIKGQLHTKFGQIMMTFLYTDNEVFLQSRLPASAAQLLSRALAPGRSPQSINDVIRLVIAMTRYNPDLVPSLFEYMEAEKDLGGKIGQSLLNAFSTEKDNDFQDEDINKEKITELITIGQEAIGKEQTRIEAELNYFIENASNHVKIFETSRRFLEFTPDFRLIGVDLNNTDHNRIEQMKTIMRQYAEFYNEQIFERRAAAVSYLLNLIHNLEGDIKDFPTYYGRCYLLPILRAWSASISAYFDEVARVSQPVLEIIEVVRCSNNGGETEAHLLISNRGGKSAASGVKVWILPSKTNEYLVKQEEYSDVGRTIRQGDDVTIPISITPLTQQPVLTLNYKITYMNREGIEVPTDELTIPLRTEQDAFQPIDPNPYAVWANADAVTEVNMFKGRDDMIARLLKYIEVERQKKMIVIYGQKRAGKSSILYHVKDRMKFPAVPVYLQLGTIALNLTVQNLFFQLARELNRSLKKIGATLNVEDPMRETFAQDPFGTFIDSVETVFEKLRSVPEYANILPVFLLDEFTYIYTGIQSGNIDPNFMKAWKSLVEKKYFAFILSGIDEMPEFISAYPNEFGMAELIQINYLDDEGSRDLIERPIWNEEKNASRFQESAVRRIFELTAGSAYYIQIFNKTLVNYMNKEHTGYVTEADVNRVLDLLISPNSDDQLNFDSHFDNLTRFKIGGAREAASSNHSEVKLEGMLLRVIASITRNQDYASKQSILSRFGPEDLDLVEHLIQRLINRDVLIVQEGQEHYQIRVELFKHWVNTNIPYREGSYESF